MKIIFKLTLWLFISLILFISYLSFVGFETKKFNDQIAKKIKNIDQNFEIELNEIKIVLDPLKLKLKIKTIGSKLKNRNKVIEIENIVTQVPLGSLFSEDFLIENLDISTKSLKVKDVISFIRVFRNTPELIILEKILKKGFLIADIKINFDKNGKINNDYKINGFIRDTKFNILKSYKAEKLNLIFNYEDNTLDIEDLIFSMNGLNFFSKNINIKNIKDDFIISGEINNKNIELDSKNVEIFIKPLFPVFNIKKIKFSSENKFSFKINKKFKLNDLSMKSSVNIDNFLLLNNSGLESFFPKMNENILLSNHKLTIIYEKNDFKINGDGDILLQKENDHFTYSFHKKNKRYNFKTSLRVNKNPLLIDFFNYEKDLNNQMTLIFNGSSELNKETKFHLISLKEKKNLIRIEGLTLDEQFMITNLKNGAIDYLDKKNQKNQFNIISKNNTYFIKGTAFNADELIENLINGGVKKSNFINKNFMLDIEFDKIFLDKKYSINNLKGNLSLNNLKVISGKLIGNFSKDKEILFSVKSDENEKITTLFSSEAEPFVSRYKFIKGFNGGVLDFSSSEKGKEKISTLKLYDFNLKELPALTKLLTLASLQGIADLLSGEGIRFNEFEMNFKNSETLMTINEIYGIGPAISILMDGYVEKNKLISLRGTLVPATTINKAIGSIPIIGKILVGTKTGEGVFGVSFKIKGPPKNLETTVNPIKTLTPRFITRTLEKIKKN
jgi:hypothetical protein